LYREIGDYINKKKRKKNGLEVFAFGEEIT